MEKEKQENARYGSSNLARGLFTILDNFDRALLASPKELKNKKDIEKIKRLHSDEIEDTLGYKNSQVVIHTENLAILEESHNEKNKGEQI